MSVLVLGAGMVSGPLFEYLHHHRVPFSVVSCLEKELQTVKSRFPDVKCHCLDVADPQLLSLISQHQLVINLLPPPLLPQVAGMCVEQGRNMLCASYVPPQLNTMHQKAVDAGVMLLCECGLDPGLDHMLAMEVIDKVTADGGQITSFTSWCGGIPAPECRDIALQYKFSWNPKAALLASQRDAGYIRDGKSVEVAGSSVLDCVQPVNTTGLLPGVSLEGLPNMLHQHHLQAYRLEAVAHFFRGTLRYQGFCDAVKGLIQAGLFSQLSLPCLQSESPPLTWKTLMTCMSAGAQSDEDFEAKLLEKLEGSASRLEVLKGLGLLSDTAVDKQGTPFDTLAAHVLHTLAYAPGERDMIVMQHEIGSKLPGQPEEVIGVGLVVYGDSGGHSAMAKTVGFPVGIVARMILNGEIERKGVVLPTTPDIYQPVLAALKDFGISATGTTLSA